MMRFRWIGLASAALLLTGCGGATQTVTVTATPTADAAGSAAAPTPSGSLTPTKPAAPTGSPAAPESPSTEPPTGALATPSATPTPTSTAELVGRNIGLINVYDADNDTVTIDVVYFYVGDDALKYIEENPEYQDRLECFDNNYNQVPYGTPGAQCEVPNGYLIINENPLLRTFPLANDVSIRLIDWSNCCEAVGADRATLAMNSESHPILAWFVVEPDGTVSSIEEQYTP